MADLIPAAVTALRQYDRRTFASDALAGITVGLVALPLAMAFAIASGLPPQSGLYCAVVAGFHVPAIDASGLQALEDLADRLHESGRTLLLCGARDQPARVMQRAEFHEHMGEGNICANVEAALERAATIAAEKGLAA